MKCSFQRNSPTHEDDHDGTLSLGIEKAVVSDARDRLFCMRSAKAFQEPKEDS